MNINIPFFCISPSINQSQYIQKLSYKDGPRVSQDQVLMKTHITISGEHPFEVVALVSPDKPVVRRAHKIEKRR